MTPKGQKQIKWKPVVERAAEIVRSYGTGVTLRQLFYRLVAEQLISNRDTTYGTLSDRTANARRYDGFPGLVDRTRRISQPYFLDDPDDAVRSLTADYRRDRQIGQPVSLYVGVEKDALSALLEGWLDEFGIPVLVMRGWHSESYERSIIDHIRAEERPAVLLYFGDLDPAGEGIEANIVKHIPFDTVERVALTLDQANEHGLPENPDVDEKLLKTPGRYAFQAKYGRLFQIEIDALPPDVLRTMVLDAVGQHLDRSAYESLLEVETAELALLTDLQEQWNDLRDDDEEDQ